MSEDFSASDFSPSLHIWLLIVSKIDSEIRDTKTDCCSCQPSLFSSKSDLAVFNIDKNVKKKNNILNRNSVWKRSSKLIKLMAIKKDYLNFISYLLHCHNFWSCVIVVIRVKLSGTFPLVLIQKAFLSISVKRRFVAISFCAAS